MKVLFCVTLQRFDIRPVFVHVYTYFVYVTECSVVELRCDDSLCLHEDKWCDDVVDCLDGSDEPPLCYLGTVSPFNLCF